MARLLGVRRPSNRGYVILGAQPLARLLARLLKEHGHEAVLIDVNATHCKEAEAEGLSVIYGNVFDEAVQLRAQFDTRRATIAVVHNEAVNLRFGKLALKELKVPRAYALLERNNAAAAPADLAAAGISLMGGRETDPELWSVRLRRGTARTEVWTRDGGGDATPDDLPDAALALLLPLFRVEDDGRLIPVDETMRCGESITVHWLVFADRADDARALLEARGWSPGGPAAKPD
jgi:hypothetical protein